MVTLDFVQREDDLLAFNKHWMRTSRSYRRQLLGFSILCAVAAVCVVVWKASPGDSIISTVVIAAVAALVASLPAAPVLRAIQANAVRQLIRRESATMLGPVRMVLDGTGVREFTPRGSVNVPWHAIHRVDENATHVFIYLTPRSAFAVPKMGQERAVGEMVAHVPPHLRPAAA